MIQLYFKNINKDNKKSASDSHGTQALVLFDFYKVKYKRLTDLENMKRLRWSKQP